MDAAQLIGRHPQPARYYFRLVAGTFRTMLDMGMLVLGTALIGLAVAVILDGFGFANIGLGLSTGAMLGSALVIAVVGAFALGVASEGGYGAAESVSGFPLGEVVIGRIVGGLILGLALMWAHDQVEPLLEDLSLPLRVGEELIRATGAASFLAGLVGVPLAAAGTVGLSRVGMKGEFELPILFIFWTLFTLIMFDMPAA